MSLRLELPSLQTGLWPGPAPKATAQPVQQIEQTEIPVYEEWLRLNGPKRYSYDFRHVKAICNALQDVFDGKCDRLLICMPPRHFKTETVTVPAPVYGLLRWPHENFLVTGYNERFAAKLGRKCRTWARNCGLPLDPEKQAVDEWATLSGAVMMSRGVGSPPTGTGFRGIFIDDPIRKRQDAESEVFRESVWDWYTDDLYTRLEPDGFIVMTLTLWHEDDVAARALLSEPGKWRILKLPAIATDDDQLGRTPGEALCPERYDVDALLRIKDVMANNEGLRSWEALYQQNPTPREGSFFDVSKLGFVDTLPAGMKGVRSWDAAATADDGDKTAGVRMDGPDQDGFYYISHATVGQWESARRDAEMRLTKELDGPRIRITVPQDPGAAGKSQVMHWVRMLVGARVTICLPTGDKVTRADPLASQVNAGNVRIVKGDWPWKELIEVFRQFPNGAHDDEVDAAADAFNTLVTLSQGSTIKPKKRSYI